jgi:starvation-inducible outer membrane lipoprotein
VAFDTQQTNIDPAILEPGTSVTIVGEVKFPTHRHVGDRQYELPTLVIRDMTVMTVWNKDRTAPAPLTYYGSPHGYMVIAPIIFRVSMACIDSAD